MPVESTDRIDALDVLRGAAVLGIIVMNVQSFGLPNAAYSNPSAFGNLDGVNFQAWLWSHVLVEQKFMSIFSILFGAGVALFCARAEKSGRSSRGLHYRRTGLLVLFGLLHGYLLWSGDVLFLYGVCGLWIYLLRNKSPRTLIMTGLVMIVLCSVFMCLFGLSMPHWPSEELREFIEEAWRPTPGMIEQEISAYHGSYREQVVFRAPQTFMMQTSILAVWGLWRAGGLMLIGMALLKTGVLTGERSSSFYGWMGFIGMLAGLPVVLMGASQNIAHDWDPLYSFFIGGLYNYYGSLLVTAGWIGLIVGAVQIQRWRSALRPLAAVGRMALSNYIGQTFIGVFIFTGMRKFGAIDRADLLWLVLGIWIAQLIISPLWLRRFRFGPLEWLWRTLTYRERQPLRWPLARADVTK